MPGSIPADDMIRAIAEGVGCRAWRKRAPCRDFSVLRSFVSGRGPARPEACFVLQAPAVQYIISKMLESYVIEGIAAQRGVHLCMH